LGHDRPLYAFSAFSVPESGEGLPTVEALAAAYVDDLLRFQPQGPYYLCGNSIAGLIAFEMARQLRARGIRHVEVLLFDTYGPGYPQRLSLIGAIRNHMATTLHLRDPRRLVSTFEDLTMAGLERAYSSWKTRRARLRLGSSSGGSPNHGQAFTPNTDPDFGLDTINDHLAQMTQEYFARQRPYEGSIILYRATLQPWNACRSQTLGWEQYVTGSIRVEPARGDHLGILRRSNSRYLAQHVRRVLGELDTVNG
jgi:thioesterase domain-containing protein